MQAHTRARARRRERERRGADMHARAVKLRTSPGGRTLERTDSKPRDIVLRG
ncbi:hypothetical protein ALC57_03783 [Trachymyrmex cornetzi]|uniref:Uncharacterized protein n=1 Tax=Trachymyrmex cornetzi TaxID=471704 RepID=A0A195EFU8_9HYME|nr:hypothetical protein ALC57_03783 [Trachymyrmex cornetzi]